MQSLKKATFLFYSGVMGIIVCFGMTLWIGMHPASVKEDSTFDGAVPAVVSPLQEPMN